MEKFATIDTILKNNHLVINDVKDTRLILGESPYPNTSKRTKMVSNYPFNIASFVTPSFEETIQLFCVMNLFFGLDNAKILINDFKNNKVSGQDFVCYLESNFNVFLGNVSEKSKVKIFLTNHPNAKILCCGRKSQQHIKKFKDFKGQVFDIVYPGSFTLSKSSTVRQWLVFNHTNSNRTLNTFRLI
ncbi:hypothetical protein FNJ55_08235 [Lactococcus lactis]|nr:hypothetical protein FNJ55_08235 [Lactococcus lactis]